MIQNLSISKVETIIRDVSRKEILPRWQKLQEHEIDTKTGPNDLVTHADIEAEKALTKIFLKEFPGCGVIGEEAVSRKEIDIDRLLAAPPELLWVIDPVDGTWNFAHGSEIFACMVAAVYKGETVMSWIYDVTKDTFATAEKGQGAFYGETALYPASAKPKADLRGYIGLNFIPKLIKPQIKQAIADVSDVTTLRCAAHEYMNLAKGHIDFSIYSRTEPWDHLAGILLAEEAGAVCRRHDNKAYHLIDRRQILLHASGSEVWKMAHESFVRPVEQEINSFSPHP